MINLRGLMIHQKMIYQIFVFKVYTKLTYMTDVLFKKKVINLHKQL